MAYSLDLAFIKQQLNIDTDIIEDDNLLNLYKDAAMSKVQDDVQMTDDEFNLALSSKAGSKLTLAILLLIGHYYTNRDVITYGSPKMLPAYNSLISQFKIYYRPTV